MTPRSRDEAAELANLRMARSGADATVASPAKPSTGHPGQGTSMARADYHQFTLTCDSMPLEWDGRSENGLAVVGEHGGVAIQTSVASGLVRYAWATHSSRPAVEDPWDDVVEVTIATETGEIHVEGWAGATHDETNLATEGPGTYRLRVSARDRGSEWDQNVEVAKEQFRFDIWPTSI